MPAERKERTKKNNTLDIYRNHHRWDTTKSKRTLDQAKVEYYIYNNMDLTELYDEVKLYDYTWKEGSDQKKEYMKDYQRQKRNGNKGVQGL